MYLYTSHKPANKSINAVNPINNGLLSVHQSIISRLGKRKEFIQVAVDLLTLPNFAMHLIVTPVEEIETLENMGNLTIKLSSFVSTR